MDSGATSCFAGERLCRQLQAQLQLSDISSVEVANRKKSNLLGAMDIQLEMGGRKWPIRVQVLPHFLKGVDLIIGQDWMQQFRGVLDLGNGTCSLKTHNTGDVESEVITLTQLPSGHSSLQKPFFDTTIPPDPDNEPAHGCFHDFSHTCCKIPKEEIQT